LEVGDPGFEPGTSC